MVASVRQQLVGGDPRTLRHVDMVVERVRRTPHLLDELLDCVVGEEDEVVRMRASDALEKICRDRPDLLQPRVAVVLGPMARIPQASVQWHVAQMLGELPLTAHQRSRAARLLDRYLRASTDWIVLNCSLETLAALSREDDGLLGLLREHLARCEESPYRSLSSRARRLRDEFGR